MSLDKLVKSIKKLENCILKNCDKETELYHKKYIEPIMLKIQTLDKNKDMDEIKLHLKKIHSLANNKRIQKPVQNCSISHCSKEHKANFKTLSAVLQKDCKEKDNKKSCKLANIAKSLASSKELTIDDIIEFKKKEFKLK